MSVTRPSLRETSSPTYPFRSSRARLQTSSASLRSPQTCLDFRTASDASHPAASQPALRGILRSLRLLRTARCPGRRPTSDCCAASLLRNRRRSQPLSAAADIPFQGNPRPLRPRRRSSCCYSRWLSSSRLSLLFGNRSLSRNARVLMLYVVFVL